jgi:dTDP-4-dehydrorhamnose reductase
LHYSTDYVFEGRKHGRYIESDIRNPIGVYGKSKSAGEDAIAMIFAKAFNSAPKNARQYAILRTSWVYGDGENFIRKTIRLAKERGELKVVNNQYGAPTSAQWLAEVSLGLVMSSIGSLNRFTSGTYHAVPAGETSRYGLASLVLQVALELGMPLKITPNRIRPILANQYSGSALRPLNSRMSTDKIRQLFESRGDIVNLQKLNQSWDASIQAYVYDSIRGKFV